MANNYYDATGVLVLDKVTPIIQALFGGLDLDAAYPGNSQAYIARISEGSDALWDDIESNLDELAEGLGLPPQEKGDGIRAVLRRWAVHFEVENNEPLNKLIETHDFEDAADLESLFLLAACFDDGHGLKAIVMEGCWHCSKPRLFEFGGEGHFISREVVVYRGSSSVQELGNDIRDALLTGNLDGAAERLASDVNGLLLGVRDEKQRQQLKVKLVRRLLDSQSGGEPSDARS